LRLKNILAANEATEAYRCCLVPSLHMYRFIFTQPEIRKLI